MSARFQNREEAGRILAAKLMIYANRPETIVLALPRGGVPIGYEIASALNLPLDVMIVRKLGVPGHEELAMGAIASGGVRVLNRSVIESLRIPPDSLEAVEKREALEEPAGRLTVRGAETACVQPGPQLVLEKPGGHEGAGPERVRRAAVL
jgi:predicted phosphoribosyltransferase